MAMFQFHLKPLGRGTWIVKLWIIVICCLTLQSVAQWSLLRLSIRKSSSEFNGNGCGFYVYVPLCTAIQSVWLVLTAEKSHLAYDLIYLPSDWNYGNSICQFLRNPTRSFNYSSSSSSLERYMVLTVGRVIALNVVLVVI